MLIKIKYNNSSVNTTVLKYNAKQYAYVYFMRFADWFDSKSGAYAKRQQRSV